MNTYRSENIGDSLAFEGTCFITVVSATKSYMRVSRRDLRLGSIPILRLVENRWEYHLDTLRRERGLYLEG